MKINQIGINRVDPDESSANFSEYMSKVLAYMTDEEAEKLKQELNRQKQVLKDTKDNLESFKKRASKLVRDNSRLRILYEVLSNIDALRKEGVLIGQNRDKIFKLLDNIDKYSYDKLLSMNEELSLYIPETPKVVRH